MAKAHGVLDGRRGWSAVVGLSTVLAVLVAGQLPASSADRSAAPAGPVALPSLAPSAVPELPAPATGPVARERVPSVADVLPSAAARRLSLPVPAPPKPVAKAAPAARKKPVAARAAARQPAASTCSGDGWQARRGQAALDSLKPGAVARTGFRIEFRPARPGYMGLTHLKQRRIEVFVRACGVQSDELLRHVMAHELGHAYDTVRMTAASRKAWMAARGIPAGTNWYGCSACTDFATPAGDFAEVYAQWARGASTNRSSIAGDVPPAQLAALAARFFR